MLLENRRPLTFSFVLSRNPLPHTIHLYRSFRDSMWISWCFSSDFRFVDTLPQIWHVCGPCMCTYVMCDRMLSRLLNQSLQISHCNGSCTSCTPLTWLRNVALLWNTFVKQKQNYCRSWMTAFKEEQQERERYLVHNVHKLCSEWCRACFSDGDSDQVPASNPDSGCIECVCERLSCVRSNRPSLRIHLHIAGLCI